MGSLDTEKSSDEDEGNAFNTKPKAKKKGKIKNKKKKKGKKKKNEKKQTIKMMQVREGDLSLSDVEWNMDTMHKVSSAKKRKTDKKCTINELKQLKTYVLRIRLLNESGWSEYSEMYAIKTPKNMIKSKILSAKEKNKLKKMVDKHTKNEYKKEWKLLYRGSRDGFAYNSFFNKCNMKKNTLCIIQSDIDNVFGGFTTMKWDRSITGFSTKADAKAFLYLIRSSKGFKSSLFPVFPHNISGAIGHQSNYYLMFGEGANGLYLSDNCNTNRTSCVRTNCATYNMPSGSHLNGGVQSFQVKDVEVFQLK